MNPKKSLLLVLVLLNISAFLNAETFEELQKELLKKNPEVLAARDRYFAATKIPIQQGTLPDPMVNFADFGVGHPFSKLNESDFAYRSFGFSQEFPFPGKLRLRSQIAEKEADAFQQQLQATKIRLLSELKSSFVEYLYLQSSLETQEKYRDLLDELIEISEARYRVGEGLQQDVLRANLERSAIEEKLQLIRQNLDNERYSLNSLLKREIAAPLKIENDFPKQQPVPPFEELMARLTDRSPEFLTKVKEEERKQLQLSLANKDRYPDFTASLQWQKTGSLYHDYYMTMLEVSIPLYSWRKQKPAIAQAQLELKASQNEKEAELVKLERELRQAHNTATTTANLLKLYNEGIIPQGRLSLESAVSAYQVGKLEFVSLLNNAAALLNYESESLRRLTDHLKAIARIEQITGTFVNPDDFVILKESENE